ncbi:MAG: NAD-binding protein, partial [Desulfovibrio sp.]|nr:NAD-binding protein [Desulfovibrio sp.]
LFIPEYLASDPAVSASWELALPSLFQSVSARTAGFNSVDIARMTDISLLTLLALMFIGGSPGSCASGIKTTSFRILAGFITAQIRGRSQVSVMGRGIPWATLNRVFVLFTFAVLTICLGTFALVCAEGGANPHGRTPLPLPDVFFEVVSAFATAGLSTGVTPQLSPAGKGIVCLLMFIGRIGPVWMISAMQQFQTDPRYRLPQTDLPIGGPAASGQAPASRVRAGLRPGFPHTPNLQSGCGQYPALKPGPQTTEEILMRRKEIGIIGLGKFGMQLGRTLTDLGHMVVGLDTNEQVVRLASEVFAKVYQGDGTDKRILEELRFQDLDAAAVSVGGAMETSILTALNLTELQVRHILVKAVNQGHHAVLQRLGVHQIIQPEVDAATQSAMRLVNPGMLDLLPLGRGSVLVQAMAVNKWAGKTLAELNLMNRLKVMALARRKAGEKDYVFVPDPQEPLDQGDSLILIGHPDSVLSLDC